jgi:hypothetical protein
VRELENSAARTKGPHPGGYYIALSLYLNSMGSRNCLTDWYITVQRIHMRLDIKTHLLLVSTLQLTVISFSD